MICIIRIKGEIGLNRDVVETLSRLRIRKKYSCVVIKPDAEKLGMIKRVKDAVAYGDISEETFEKLIEKRGKAIDKKKKIDAKKIVSHLKEGKTYEENNLKPFFRLHPPRGGIDSKIHYGKKKGVLGRSEEGINKLVERML